MLWGPVDEAPKGADSMGAHQGVAAKGPAVYNSDVQGRVQEFVLRQVLGCWPMEPELREGARLATPATPSSALPCPADTHHFKPLDESAEVGILLVIVDQGRLHPLPCTLDVYPWPVHLGQIHPLQVPQAPKQHLGWGERRTPQSREPAMGGLGPLRRNWAVGGQ